MVNLQIIAFLKQFSLFYVNTLPKLIEGTHHVLFCHLSLLRNISLLLVKSLVLDCEIVTLCRNLRLEIFDVLHQGRISLTQKHYVVTLVVTMDDAFRTNRRRFALKAEIVDLFFWVVRTEVTLLPVRLVGH
jgi:hypothetical protein